MNAAEIVITGLLAANSAGILKIIFSAGKLSQLVADIDRRVTLLEQRCLAATRRACEDQT